MSEYVEPILRINVPQKFAKNNPLVGVLGVERNAERTALLAGGKEPYAARTYMRA